MTSTDVAALLPSFQRIARRVGRNFPSHLADENDFIQEAYLEVLGVNRKPGEEEEDYRGRQRQAGKYAMINALRAIHDTRPHRKQRGLLGFDIPAILSVQILADYQNNGSMSEQENYIMLLETFSRASLLPPRKQRILAARLKGETLKEIAEQIGRTEGRVCQLEQEILTAMKEAA